MVSEGEKFPEDLVFIADDGSEINPARIEASAIVLYFYPRAMTPGCTREALRFNELLDEFEKCRVKVFGASTDPPERNRRFKEKHGLRFTLLSDPEGRNAERLGVLKKGTKRPSAQRVTFIIKDGVIVRILKNVRPAEKHADLSLEEVKKILDCK